MAEESVRNIVSKIDKRTADLEPVLKKLSESLDNISSSFAKEDPVNRFQAKSRGELLEQFRAPFQTQSDPSSGILAQIKDTLVENHKESFGILKSISESMKNISDMSKKGPDFIPFVGSTKDLSKAVGAAASMLGVLGKAFGKIAAPIAALSGIVGAVTGAMDAAKILGKDEKDVTGADRIEAGLVGLADNLTMGLLVDTETYSQKKAEQKKQQQEGTFSSGDLMGDMGFGDIPGMEANVEDDPALNRGKVQARPPVSTAGAIATAGVGGDFKYIEEQRRKREESTSPKVEAAVPAATIPKIEAAAPEPKLPVSPATPPAPASKPTVAAAPSQQTTKASPAASASLFSTMEGDDNLEALQIKKGELQSLYSDYRDAKAKVAEQLANDRKKYPEGFIDDPSDPEYPPELKAVDDQFQPQIKALEKEVEELGKKPGIKEAKARAKAEDERFESDDFEKEDIFSNDIPEGKVKSESASIKSTSTLMQTDTTETSGGGSTTTRMTDAGKKENEEYVNLERTQQQERMELIKKLKGEGKIKGLVKFGMSQEGSPTAVPELVELEKKQKAQRDEIGKKYSGQDTYEQIIKPPEQSIESSTTVNRVSQENAEMKSEGQAIQPVIINNNNATSSNTQTVTPIKTGPRTTNNSFERKQMSVASYGT